MNRAERRKMEKLYRHSGMTKVMAKEVVNANYRAEALKEGQKCKFNYEFIVRHPDFKKQKDEFREWVISHKGDILTVDAIRNNGLEVTFVEDENEEKYWHHVETLIPVATATIKLNDGTEKQVTLDGITDVNDPKIMEEVNKVLEE